MTHDLIRDLRFLAMRLPPIFSLQAKMAADAEAEWLRAVTYGGIELAEECRDYAQTIPLPNHEVFSMCWKAGGKEYIEAGIHRRIGIPTPEDY